MAREGPGQTLQPTALVHEAYLRLVDVAKAQHWDSRRHFFAAAAEAMRRILVENARRKKRLRHGGAFQRVELAEDLLAAEGSSEDVLAVNEALDQLAAADPPTAELVKLVYFAGLTMEQAAETLGLCAPHRLPQLGLRPRLALPAPRRGRATSFRHAIVFRPAGRFFWQSQQPGVA